MWLLEMGLVPASPCTVPVSALRTRHQHKAQRQTGLGGEGTLKLISFQPGTNSTCQESLPAARAQPSPCRGAVGGSRKPLQSHPTVRVIPWSAVGAREEPAGQLKRAFPQRNGRWLGKHGLPECRNKFFHTGHERMRDASATEALGACATRLGLEAHFPQTFDTLIKPCTV